MQFFSQCNTIEEVKATFKTLAKTMHPDMGGSTEQMQQLNAEYSFVIAKLASGQGLSNEAVNDLINDNEAYRQAVEAIVNLPGIIIELVGAWVWVSGNTFGYKDILKANKFMWASAKKMWFFRTEDKKASNGGKSFDITEIRAKYGSQSVNAKGRQAIG